MNSIRPYPPDWLDAEGAAYLLCLPVSTFHEYVAAGKLPDAIKIGKHARWSREALNASLADLANPANGPTPAELAQEAEHGQKTKGRRHAA